MDCTIYVVKTKALILSAPLFLQMCMVVICTELKQCEKPTFSDIQKNAVKFKQIDPMIQK